MEPVTPTEILIEPHELEPLLDALTSKKVLSFQGFGITVVFQEEEPKESTTTVAAAQVVDDGHSTSPKRVEGFQNKALWPWQNGRRLNFKGELV